jgi:hypothetical protein
MKKHNWKILFLIFLLATIIDIFVPDPLPFVDEIALMTGTIYSLWRTT